MKFAASYVNDDKTLKNSEKLDYSSKEILLLQLEKHFMSECWKNEIGAY